jgi:hypothetical protein
MLLPAVVACASARSRPWARTSVALVIAQALWFAPLIERVTLSWYRPPERQEEIAHMVRALPKLVPEGEAVAADFMNSTAILAHTGRPVLFQPKWESRASRERVRDLFALLYDGPPERMRRVLLEKYDCRYLLVDRYTLFQLGRYAAGLPLSAREPPRGSAAHALLSSDERVLGSIPGYRLLYRSPPTIRQPSGAPTDFFRLFELSR